MELPGVAEPNPIYGLPGMAQISPAPFDLAYSVLPSGIRNSSVAAIGTRIFYIVEERRILSTVVGRSSQPTILATAPACHSIDQIAAAGHGIAYVETWPIGMPFEASGCGSQSSLAWSIWLLDLQTGLDHIASAGVTTAESGVAPHGPVQVALSDTAYAFDRPSSPIGQSPTPPSADLSTPGSAGGGTAAGGGEVVEVRSVSDNRLLWSTRTGGAVNQLMLGGTQLAVVESGPDSATAGPSLSIADPVHPILRTVSHPSSAASISDDGSYLAWDVAGSGSLSPSGVELEALGSGATTFVAAQSGVDPRPLRPAVSAGDGGAIVAWLATAAGGSVYPAFRTSPTGRATAIASVQTTAWLTLQGTVLIWIGAAIDGSLGVAYSIDLAGTHTGSWRLRSDRTVMARSAAWLSDAAGNSSGSAQRSGESVPPDVLAGLVVVHPPIGFQGSERERSPAASQTVPDRRADEQIVGRSVRAA